MAEKRVIGIIPVHESKRPIIHNVIENISLSDYPLTCLILVNNSTPHFLGYVFNLVRKYKTVNVKFEVIDLGKITGNLGQIYSQAVNWGYDFAEFYGFYWAVVIGADILMPFSAIREMLACFKKYKKTGVVCLTCYYRAPGMVPMPMVIPKKKLIKRVSILSMKQYYANKYLLAEAGNGAMMVPREVYTRVKWRVENLEKTGADIQFCFDIRDTLKRPCRIITNLETPHIDNDGKLFWSKTENPMEPIINAISEKNVEAKRK